MNYSLSGGKAEFVVNRLPRAEIDPNGRLGRRCTPGGCGTRSNGELSALRHLLVSRMRSPAQKGYEGSLVKARDS